MEDFNKGETSFTDRKGTVWDITLTFAGARRIDNSDFSILGIEEGFSILEPRRDIFNKILGDSRLAMAVIWAIVQPQVKDNLGIDPETDYDKAELEFYERLDGSVIASAKDELWGTITNFFPEQRTALSSLKKAWSATQNQIGKELEGLEPELMKTMEEQVRKEMGTVRAELAKLRTASVVGSSSSK